MLSVLRHNHSALWCNISSTHVVASAILHNKSAQLSLTLHVLLCYAQHHGPCALPQATNFSLRLSWSSKRRVLPSPLMMFRVRLAARVPLGALQARASACSLLPSDILAVQSRCFVCDILQLTVTYSLVCILYTSMSNCMLALLCSM